MTYDSDSESEDNEINCHYIRENKTETHIFSYSKPSILLDNLLIKIQAKCEVTLNDWVIEYPKENPRVRITFMKVQRKHSKMVCCEFLRVSGSYQDFLQEFEKCKNFISDDIDADTEDSDKEYNPLDSDSESEDQEMMYYDVEEVKHSQL